MNNEIPTIKGRTTLSNPSRPQPEPKPEFRTKIQAISQNLEISNTQLATAIAVQGILHGAALDTIGLAVCNRLDEAGHQLINELDAAIKRHRATPASEPAPEATDHRQTDTPHVGVRWPSCPACGFDGRDKTFTGANRRHTLSDGSPGVYAKCRQCEAPVVVEHWNDSE